jgi:VanZ family protein
LLLMRALRNEIRNESIRRPLLLSIVFTILYAASDEFHQSFVPSRSASVFDVMIDTTGGICGTLLSYLRNHRTKTLSNPP